MAAMGLGKDIAASVGIAALMALGGGVAGYASVDEPAPIVVEQRAEAPEVEISDPTDLLSAEDEARLLRDVERLDHPSTVRRIHFIMLNDGREKVNDTVENYLRDNFPDEIGDDKFADGVLILGADMNSRKNFILSGEDVADQLLLRSGERLEPALEAMKPGLQNDNLPAGLFAAVDKATSIADTESYNDDWESERTGMAAVMAGGFGLAGAGGGAVAVAVRENRRKAIAQARANHEAIAREYTDLSGRLDELDIRANSVSSSFANAELREQWEEVRDRFLSLHDATQRLSVGTDRQAYENRKELAAAAQTLEDAGHAEDNINRLFRVEQGDSATRRSMLTDIRADVKQARREVKDQELKRDLEGLEAHVEWLDHNTEDPGFLDEFVRMLQDYRQLMDEVRRREFSDVEEYEELRSPTITDPGYYYSGLTPYIMLDSWHASNVAAHEAASSSSSTSVDTTFSSGFSGSGGSSSF